MKFAHLADCHLGGWRQPELKELNFQYFKYALDKCIIEKVDFIIIAGDLFDSAYPPIETLKETFFEFRKLKEKNIPVFIIAGSHDYSVSGKTFLDVLEKAGLCKNIAIYEEHQGNIMLLPTIYQNVAFYGYPGRKSGMEVEDLERIKLQDSPGLMRILVLHTALRDAVGSLPIKAVNPDKLPKVDYVALGHLHIQYQKNNRAYSGPIFPNTSAELEELEGGSFIIYDNGAIRREPIKLKKIITLTFTVSNAMSVADEVINAIKDSSFTDAVVLLKLQGILSEGNTSDINFERIESEFKKKNVFSLLKSTTKLLSEDIDTDTPMHETENLEDQIIKSFEEGNPSKFNTLILPLLKALQMEKQEDEKSAVFEDRLTSEVKKIILDGTQENKIAQY